MFFSGGAGDLLGLEMFEFSVINKKKMYKAKQTNLKFALKNTQNCIFSYLPILAVCVHSFISLFQS